MGVSVSNWANLAIFLPPIFTSDFFQPFKQIFIYLKDTIDIYLEPEAQGHGITFKVCNICSIYPFFTSYSGKLLTFTRHNCISSKLEQLLASIEMINEI